MAGFGRIAFTVLALAALALFGAPAQASPIGGDPPARCGRVCPTCTAPSAGGTRISCPNPAPCANGSCISRTEGNLRQTYNVPGVRNANGPQLTLDLAYNSYNADGSRTRLQTVLGTGWTHSYNVFLFSYASQIFRFDGDGRVTKYQLATLTTYKPVTGYFETIVKNSDGSFTITDKYHTVYLFRQGTGAATVAGEPAWWLVSITDRDGNVTTLTYNSTNLTAVTNTYGQALTFTYNASHHLTAVADPDGQTTTFTYNSTGTLLTQITDALGHVTQYTYNTLDQMTSDTDKDGRVFTYSYTGNEPTGDTDSTGTSYFSMSNPVDWEVNQTELQSQELRTYVPSTTSSTDGRGNVWKYQYDSNGYVLSAIAPDGATTSYTYDSATLMPATMTDPDGHTTSYTYNASGDLLSQTDPLGFVTTYTYEPVYNQMTSTTDPRGRTTTYTIDPSTGNRTQEKDPLGNTLKWTYDAHGNVLTATDKDGNTTTNTYDTHGNRVTSTDPLGNETKWTYDADGNLLSTTDADTHTTNDAYDGLNRLVTVTDALGFTTTTVYDGEGNRVETIDRDNNATHYQYDQRQRLIKTTDALSYTTSSMYDPDDNVISSTDQNGHVTTFIYDVENRRVSMTDALGHTSSMTYDPAGNVLSATDANGHTTSYVYDGLNRVTSMTDPLSNVAGTQYDTITVPNSGPCGGGICTGPTPGSGLPTETTDADGNVTQYGYDGLDRLIETIRVTTASNAVDSSTYDPDGNVLTMTEPDGNTITNAYDLDDRKISMVNSAGDTTTMTYDGVGNVITTTSPTGDVTTDQYDADNRLITITDTIGSIGSLTYDPEGHQITATDGNGNVTSTTYDAIYRVVTMSDPLGKSSIYAYDPVGNLLTTTDRNGNTTSAAFDSINRRVAVTDSLGNVTKFQYDPVGNLIVLIDANGHFTQYSFDADNRPSSETYADGFSRDYAYDGVGNLISRTDQNGVVTNYTYSQLYFLTARNYPASSTSDTMTYDLSGRILSGTHSVPSASFTWTDNNFTYDGADRMIQSVQNGETITYQYVVPAITTQTIHYPGGRVLTETYDLRMRLTQLDDTSSPPPIAQYTYDSADRVLQRNYNRNGTMATFTYDADDRIISLQHAKGATPFATFQYAYDNEGNKNYENKAQTPATSEAYQYDNTYRLITYQVGTLSGSTIPVPSTQSSYTLDPVGNWNKKVTTDGSTITDMRTHNAVNEITQDNSTSYTYDNNGNLLNDGNYAYTYDEENRLTSVTQGSTVLGQYQYDAFSRRVQKLTNGGATTTQYFYDGPRAIEEQDGSGHTNATYVFGTYTDEALNMERGGNDYYYHQNALASVEALTNSSGAVVDSYAYDAYGKPSAPSSVGNPLFFTGQEQDVETGLYYYRARYYDDMKGRYLERDPREYKDSFNLYSYVNDRPTYNVDASGEATVLTKFRFWHAATGNPYNLGVSYPVARYDVKMEVGCTQDAGMSAGGMAIANTAGEYPAVAPGVRAYFGIYKSRIKCDPGIAEPAGRNYSGQRVAIEATVTYSRIALKDAVEKGADIGGNVGGLFGPWGEKAGKIYGGATGFYVWLYDFADFTATASSTYDVCCQTCCVPGTHIGEPKLFFSPTVNPSLKGLRGRTTDNDVAIAITQQYLAGCGRSNSTMLYARNASIGASQKAIGDPAKVGGGTEWDSSVWPGLGPQLVPWPK